MHMIGDVIPVGSEIEDVGAGKITRYHKVIGYSVGDVCIEDGKLEADIKYETETLENIGLNFTISGDKYYEH